MCRQAGRPANVFRLYYSVCNLSILNGFCSWARGVVVRFWAFTPRRVETPCVVTSESRAVRRAPRGEDGAVYGHDGGDLVSNALRGSMRRKERVQIF